MHSAQYKKILESRKTLPIFAQMEEFLKMVGVYASASSALIVPLGQFSENQTTIMVGETGSGKSTQ